MTALLVRNDPIDVAVIRAVVLRMAGLDEVTPTQAPGPVQSQQPGRSTVAGAGR